MKLNKLYCNKDEIFPQITFNEGLNVLLGEIRDPSNREKTTHNIGKSTFIRIIDFCLLKGVWYKSFWRENPDRFKEFIFFLELKYEDEFLTIKRSFENDTRVCLKKHTEGNQDFFKSAVKWDHEDITVGNAKNILDGILDFEIIKPWDYRKITSYLLRVQDDYSDIFRLSKHAGRDIDWKPPLAQLLGLNGILVEKAYKTDDKITEIDNKIELLTKRVDEFKDDPDRLNGLIQLKREEINNYSEKLRQFDFKEVEDEINKSLIDEIEKDISYLNSNKYYIKLEINSIEESINKESNFSIKKTAKLFEEAGVLLGNEIQKSYEELLNFNRKITSERKKYLKVELQNKKDNLNDVEENLNLLNKRRKDALSKIREKETFEKYKKLGERLSDMKLSLLKLESINEDMSEIEKLNDKLDEEKKVRVDLTKKMREELKKPSGRYSNIKSTYNSIINKVINRTAMVNTKVNKSGNYEFEAPFVDEEGISTSEDTGHTFKKLQCIAFDSAIVMNSLDMKFPHFVIHDGVLETLENRMRLNLLDLLKDQASKGLQEIITVIDSHLPTKEDGEKYSFEDDEIIRILHDQGDEGKLFKMPSW